MRRVLPALAAALLLAVSPGHAATVRVPVANVWAAPGPGHLPLDPHVWPTGEVTLSQRLALVGHMPTEVLYGEQVLVLAVRPGWTKIAVPDQPSPLDRRGYPGWVRSWQLGPAVAAPRVVTARSARLANGTEVGFGSQVPAGAVPAAATTRTRSSPPAVPCRSPTPGPATCCSTSTRSSATWRCTSAAAG